MVKARRVIDLVRNRWQFLLGLVLSLSLLWPVYKQGYFSHHDDVQVVRIYEMHQCFIDHQFPCRWVPHLGLGYGQPLFNYYAPLPYYVGEVAYLLSRNFIFAAKTLFFISFVGSYLTMYLLGKKLWGESGGVFSAVLYVTAPYHAASLFVRGAMGELWGMLFIPLIFYFLFCLSEKQNKENIFGLGISLTLLIMSHNLSMLMITPFLGLVILYLSLKKKNLKFLRALFFSGLVAIGLSAFYFFPALLEKRFVHIDSMTVGYFSYTEHFKGFTKMLGNSWDWRPSIREFPGSEIDASWYNIGWVHLVVLVVAFAMAYLSRKHGFGIVMMCISLVLVASFLVHPRSIFIWQTFEPLMKYIQFPWRFLMVVIFFLSMAGGYLFSFKIKYQKWVWTTLVIIFLVFNFRFFVPEKFIGVTQNDYLTGGWWDAQIRRSIFDYTPIYAKLPPPGPAPDEPEILDGKVKILNYEKGSDWQKGSFEVTSLATLRLPLYDFPGMKVYLDGNEISHVNNDCRNETYCMGLVTFQVPTGTHTMVTKLYNTPIRWLGNVLSILTLTIVLLVLRRK
jgi:hypothetical protein